MITWKSLEEVRKITTNLGEKLTEALREIAKENPKLARVIDIKDFNETSAGQRVISDEALAKLIEILNKHRLGLGDVEPDILGRAYEYLLRKFAEGSGQSAGEFYTPREVAILMARIIDAKEGEEVYDPACGSGGLLIKSQLYLRDKKAAMLDNAGGQSKIDDVVKKPLIHKDYLSPAEIQIKVYDDKIWMWNPGELPKELSIEDLKREHSSYPRNPLIANVFYLAGFIELWGSGTKRIVDLCKEQGLPEPDYKEEQGGFGVWFYKDIYTEENLRKLGLNERQIKAVMYIKEEGKITNREYQEITKVSKSTATRDLSELVKRSILKQKGVTGKGTQYTLKGPQKTQKTHKGLTKDSKGPIIGHQLGKMRQK